MNEGQRAKIYNGWDEAGKPQLEGIATLKELRKSFPFEDQADPDYGELWMVEFDDEPGEIYQRTVWNKHIIE